MSAEDLEPSDPFADLLAAYEDALLHGAPAGPAVRPPPELQSRLHEALQCVRMLQRLWPAAPLSLGTETDGRRGQRYRLLRLHAVGGVGQVWLAEDDDLGREVALKEPRPERAADPAFAMRFLHEARITGRLQHPGVVPVYELVPDADGGPPFYAMRFVRGRTLTEAIQAYHAHEGATALELNVLLGALVGICNTVAYAHSQGIIHRDLKSANVVLGNFGEVVLLDWGFAKELDDDEHEMPGDADAAPGHTVAGQVVGTPAYMAPEQAAGQRDRIDERTDVYGLGAILYEILTGRPPFTGNDTRELIRQAREELPPQPRDVNRLVHPALAAVCMRALAREPADRYASATDLAGDVQRWLADEPTAAYRESRLERLRRWGRRHKPAVAGLAALLVTGFTALMLSLVLLEREQARTAEVQVRAAVERAEADAKARDVLERHLYIERLSLAERELAANNLARATQLLAECPAERCGWEWHCLQRLCHTDLLVLRGHPRPVSGAVFCLDGRRIVSASHDHTLKMWDADTGRLLQTLTGHTNVIHCLAASPDGRRIASGDWDRTVRVWDAETGRELHKLPDHTGQVIRVAFFPDSRLLAAVSDNVVKVWDAITGAPVRTIKEKDGVYGLAISLDGRLLATGCGDNVIRLRDAGTGALVRELRGHTAAPKHLAFSPDGQRLAAGDGDTLQSGPGTLKVWEVSTGRELRSMAAHTYTVYSVAFSPDGLRLVSGGQDNEIKVWDPEQGQLVLTLRGHADVVRSLTFTADGQRLASASADRTVRVWDARPWTAEKSTGEVITLRSHTERLIGVGYTNDGKSVATLAYDSVLKFWDAETGRLLRTTTVDERNGTFHSFTASARGNRLAMATGSGAVTLVDAETGRENGILMGHGAGPVKGLAFSPDGKHLATAEWRHSVRVWNLTNGKPPQVLEGHLEPVVTAAFSSDGRLLASGSYDQTVKVWDVTAAKELRTLEGHVSRVTAVAFRPEGKMLASASNDGLIKLWDVQSGLPLHELRGHTAAVCGLAFGPDGRWLASAGDDWSVKLWDVSKGELITTFRGHTGAVRVLAISPDGRHILTGSHDRTARIWRVP